MILFLYGKDTFRSRQQLHRMKEKFRADRDPSGYNIVHIDATEEKQSGRMMGEILALPFLAERRMVVIEGLLATKSHAGLWKDLLGRMEEQSIPESTVLVLWEGEDAVKGKEATALFERLKKEKYSQRFDMLSGAAFAQWIAAEAVSRGGKMTKDAVQYVAAHTGNSWEAHALLDILIAYRNGEEIRQEDAEVFLNKTSAENMFALVDAIIDGRAKDAWALLAAQYENGDDAGYVFAMVIRQCRILLELRDLCDRNDALSSDSLAKKLSLHPFVVKKSLAAVKRMSMAELSRMHEALLQFDMQIKTGQGKLETLLDLLIGRLATKTSA